MLTSVCHYYDIFLCISFPHCLNRMALFNMTRCLVCYRHPAASSRAGDLAVNLPARCRLFGRGRCCPLVVVPGPGCCLGAAGAGGYVRYGYVNVKHMLWLPIKSHAARPAQLARLVSFPPVGLARPAASPTPTAQGPAWTPPHVRIHGF